MEEWKSEREKCMTEAELLKVLDQKEKRFKDAGFGRGLVLAKSAREQYDAVKDWRRKSAAFASEYGPAQKKYAAARAKIEKLEESARKMLAEARRLRSESLKARTAVKNGDTLKTRERAAYRRFEEKVKQLRTMAVSPAESA